MSGAKPRQRAAAHRHEQRIAEPAQHRERVLAGAGDADRRVRLLVRPRHRARVVEAVILAVVRERVLGPRLLHDFERLVKALAAFRIGHAIGGIAARVAAAPGTEEQAPAARLVDRRGLLGQPQRMVQRQHMHRRADLDPLRARGELPGDVERRAQYRTPRLLMDFGQPEHVEAPALGVLGLLEALLERVGVALPRHLPVKFMIPAEFHDASLNARHTDAAR